MRVCWKKLFWLFPPVSHAFQVSTGTAIGSPGPKIRHLSKIIQIYSYYIPLERNFKENAYINTVDLYPHPVFWKLTTSQSSNFWEWVYHFVKFIHFLTETFLPCPIPSPINIRSQVLYCLQKPRWEKDLDEY